MKITLSGAILASIDEYLQRIRGSRIILDVYKAAEAIRLIHIEENVAREDIIKKLVLRAGSNAAIEFNLHADEDDDDDDELTHARMEWLMPEANLKSIH
jgi:hypothetical protein